ncbi:hypothetical protein [Aureimonas sp. AU40]|nr:hypothetical protein [Aureimonas sp. AU40]
MAFDIHSPSVRVTRREIFAHPAFSAVVVAAAGFLVAFAVVVWKLVEVFA